MIDYRQILHKPKGQTRGKVLYRGSIHEFSCCVAEIVSVDRNKGPEPRYSIVFGSGDYLYNVRESSLTFLKGDDA